MSTISILGWVGRGQAGRECLLALACKQGSGKTLDLRATYQAHCSATYNLLCYALSSALLLICTAASAATAAMPPHSAFLIKALLLYFLFRLLHCPEDSTLLQYYL